MSVQEDLRKAERRPDDVIAEVLRDHAEIKRLFGEVESARTPDDKDVAFRRLVHKLVVHETAEQEVLHPLARTGPDGSSVVAARLEEEKRSTEVLTELEKMGVEDPAFDARLAELRADVEEHAEREETLEHPRLEEAIDAERLKVLAPVFRAAEAAAPTHPHPHSPTSAIGNLVVGPPVAIMDRARDALREARRRLEG